MIEASATADASMVPVLFLPMQLLLSPSGFLPDNVMFSFDGCRMIRAC